MKLILELLGFLYRILIKPFLIICFKLYYSNDDKLKQLPPIDDQILLTPANQLAKKIRNRELKSYDVVKAYIDRIKQVQPLLNCVVAECYEDALNQAKVIDELLSSKSQTEELSEEKKPLLGVPFTCKECIWCEGMPNTTGLVKRKEFRAPHDADVVRHMRQAGGILLCLTNTSELCMWFESSNYLHGTTRNPYNPSRIVGGSSGGEGCIVGAGASIIGIGSDIGGSIRMPAFFNGVYGHKCTTKTISNKTQHPPPIDNQENMLATGPICRYASDLALLFKIQAGPSVFKEMFENKFATKIDFSKLNYFVIREIDSFFTSKMSTSSKKTMDRAVSSLESQLNINIKSLKLKNFKYSFQIWSANMSNGEKSSKNFSHLLVDKSPDDELNPYYELIKSVFGKSQHTLPALGLSLFERIPVDNHDVFIKKGQQLKEELKQILGDNGVLLFPGFPRVAPFHNQPLWTNLFDYVYYGIFNALGFPSTQCPLGLCAQTGLPQGIQVISNFHNDHLCIRLAEYLEMNVCGWTPPY